MPSRSILLIALCLAALAEAQSPIDFPSKTLATAKDSRNRANAAILLGQSRNPLAVPPLCKGLNDPEPIVRVASAKALGELGESTGTPCLEKQKGDSDDDVRFAVKRSLEMLVISAALKPGGMYVLMELNDETGRLSASDTKLAVDLMHKKLASIGAAVGPQPYDPKIEGALIRSKKLKGWLLKVKVQPYSTGMKMDLLALTYPDNAIKGNVSVKTATAAKPAALIQAMSPKLIDEAADEFEWTP
jgi:hypothetical protein